MSREAGARADITSAFLKRETVFYGLGTAGFGTVLKGRVDSTQWEVMLSDLGCRGIMFLHHWHEISHQRMQGTRRGSLTLPQFIRNFDS